MQAVLLHLRLETSCCGDSLSLLFTDLPVMLARAASTSLVRGWEENTGFLCILALIPVANQSSQEWK